MLLEQYICVQIINHSATYLNLPRWYHQQKKSALNSCCFHMNICIIVQRWVFDVRDLRNLTLKVSTRCEAASCKDSSEVRLQGIAVEAHLFAAGLILWPLSLCVSLYQLIPLLLPTCLQMNRWDRTGLSPWRLAAAWFLRTCPEEVRND